jgi:hypothetical protein
MTHLVSVLHIGHKAEAERHACRSTTFKSSQPLIEHAPLRFLQVTFLGICESCLDAVGAKLYILIGYRILRESKMGRDRDCVATSSRDNFCELTTADVRMR